MLDIGCASANDLAVLAGEGDVDARDDVLGFDGVFYVVLLDLHGADFSRGADGEVYRERAVDQVADFGTIDIVAGTAPDAVRITGAVKAPARAPVAATAAATALLVPLGLTTTATAAPSRLWM